MTPDELSFLEYATALSDWLAPFHNYTRPSPAAVLAEAAKQSELKTGFPLKGYEHTASNGSTSNGHAKKTEEPPALAEIPEVVIKFFDSVYHQSFYFARFSHGMKWNADMSLRFKETLDAGGLPPELLQIVTLAQEVSLCNQDEMHSSHLYRHGLCSPSRLNDSSLLLL